MGKKVFISYSHEQGEWVWKNLAPCLAAGGAQVIIDRERAEAGKAIIAQMDAQQNQADLSVLVLSPDYFASSYCRHEMNRALARDPEFLNGAVVPVLRVDCPLPPDLKKTLYADLQDDNDAAEWDKLMQACAADLGATAPAWLKTRDEMMKSFRNGKSICLETQGRVAWRGLFHDLRENYFFDLHRIDFQSGVTCSRRALVEEILRLTGSKITVPREPEDLKILHRVFEGRGYTTRVAFLHFEMVAGREYHNKADFFAALKHLIERHKLAVMIQTRIAFNELLPPELQDSPIANLAFQKLQG